MTPLLHNFIQHDHLDECRGKSKELNRVTAMELPMGLEILLGQQHYMTNLSDLQSTDRHAKRYHFRGILVVWQGFLPGLTAKGHLRCYVQHNYHDHANDAPCSDESNYYGKFHHSMPSSSSVAFSHKPLQVSQKVFQWCSTSFTISTIFIDNPPIISSPECLL